MAKSNTESKREEMIGNSDDESVDINAYPQLIFDGKQITEGFTYQNDGKTIVVPPLSEYNAVNNINLNNINLNDSNLLEPCDYDADEAPLEMTDNSGNKISTVEEFNFGQLTDVASFTAALIRVRGLELNEEEKDLIARCFKYIDAEEEDEINLSPGDFLIFILMAENHPNQAQDILACSSYISDNVDFMGDLPDDAYLKAAITYGKFDNLFDKGEKLNALLKDGKMPEDNDSEVTEETVTDEDEGIEGGNLEAEENVEAGKE